MLKRYIMHPYWATHAMSGFNSFDECVKHANEFSPEKSYGVSCSMMPNGSYLWQWYYPLNDHAVNFSEKGGTEMKSAIEEKTFMSSVICALWALNGSSSICWRNTSWYLLGAYCSSCGTEISKEVMFLKSIADWYANTYRQTE